MASAVGVMISHHHPDTKADASRAFAGAGKPLQETRMMEMQPVSDRIPISERQ
jgi:hypothetical protein